MCQYVVWEHVDPRKTGDNFSEVNKTVSFIGSRKQAHKHYCRMKAMLRFAGTSCNYFGYPVKIKPNENLKIGEKEVIHTEKTQPDDDDYHDQNIDEDFFDIDYKPNW